MGFPRGTCPSGRSLLCSIPQGDASVTWAFCISSAFTRAPQTSARWFYHLRVWPRLWGDSQAGLATYGFSGMVAYMVGQCSGEQGGGFLAFMT